MKSYSIQNQNALHFLTLTVVGWVDIFSRKAYRDIIIESLRFCQMQKGLTIFAYVVMTNHLHLIVRAEEGSQLSSILRDFKQFTAKKILTTIQNEPESRKDWMNIVFSYHAKFNARNRKLQLWQQYNHPIELKSPKWIQQKLLYVHNNPVRARIVDKPEHFRYSSARNYFGEKGLLEVTILEFGATEGYVFL